ncbi:MAG TPA: hypothetical protein VNP72_04465 [Longimicrobium sp.]|nr:hypothetical protein [Longimicrobium sp.]
MSAAPECALPSEVPFTLADAIGLRVPLCFVVEPDALWAECAMEALLEEYAREREVADGGAEITVARWTRTRRWTSYAATYGFGLAGGQEPLAQVDVLEELVRLAEHLDSGPRAAGGRALDSALFAVRGVEADLGRPAAAEVLLDLSRQLTARQGTMLIELRSHPRTRPEWAAAVRLGPVFPLPPAPRPRYARAIADVVEAARALGAAEPEPHRVAEMLMGLTRLQAELAARLARAEGQMTGRGAEMLALLQASRARVCAVLAGVEE